MLAPFPPAGGMLWRASPSRVTVLLAHRGAGGAAANGKAPKLSGSASAASRTRSGCQPAIIFAAAARARARREDPVPRAGVLAGDERAEQVILLRCAGRVACPSRAAEDRSEEEKWDGRHDHVHAGPQPLRDPLPGGAVEKGPSTSMPRGAGRDRHGGHGEVLAAHGRVGAVSADQDIAGGGGPVGEAGRYGTAGKQAVIHQASGRTRPRRPARGQDLAQEHPVGRVGLLRGVRCLRVHDGVVDDHQGLEPLGEEPELSPACPPHASARKAAPRAGREAGVQCPAARRADVEPVAVQSFGPAPVALVDGNLDAGLGQALGQAQAPWMPAVYAMR